MICEEGNSRPIEQARKQLKGILGHQFRSPAKSLGAIVRYISPPVNQKPCATTKSFS